MEARLSMGQRVNSRSLCICGEICRCFVSIYLICVMGLLLVGLWTISRFRTFLRMDFCQIRAHRRRCLSPIYPWKILNACLARIMDPNTRKSPLLPCFQCIVFNFPRSLIHSYDTLHAFWHEHSQNHTAWQLPRVKRNVLRGREYSTI